VIVVGEKNTTFSACSISPRRNIRAIWEQSKQLLQIVLDKFVLYVSGKRKELQVIDLQQQQ